MSSIAELIKIEIGKVIDMITSDLIVELKAQGHNNTGKLINSISSEITIASTAIVGSIYGEEYGLILNDGVKPSRVPYSPGSGARQSKFIDALIGYFRSKGYGEILAKRYAFATAIVQKREGIPTRASYRFSSNGRRTGWIDRTIELNQNRIEDITESNVLDIFERIILAA